MSKLEFSLLFCVECFLYHAVNGNLVNVGGEKTETEKNTAMLLCSDKIMDVDVLAAAVVVPVYFCKFEGL